MAMEGRAGGGQYLAGQAPRPGSLQQHPKVGGMSWGPRKEGAAGKGSGLPSTHFTYDTNGAQVSLWA